MTNVRLSWGFNWALAWGLIWALQLGSGCVPEVQSPLAPPLPTGPVDLELPRLGGGRLRLSHHRGKPVVVTLFTTWSLRSQAESPLFNQLHERRNQEFQVVGIALDRNFRLVQTYAEVMQLRYPVGLSSADDLDLVAALGQVKQVPRTILLDAEGRIVLDQDSGQTHFEALLSKIASLKRGQSPKTAVTP